MDIYSTNKYRKIWEHFNGPIPVDEEGRTYEIHHIDGNHSNNNEKNLQAVPIREHYNIHYAQEDWAACILISKRMNSIEMTKQQRSLLSKNNALKRIKDGSHNFLDRDFQIQRGLKNKEYQSRLMESGEHIFCKTVTCPHCGKIGKGAIMKRWHFDNCKEKH